MRSAAVTVGDDRLVLVAVLVLAVLVTAPTPVTCVRHSVSPGSCSFEPPDLPTSVECDLSRSDTVSWKQ